MPTEGIIRQFIANEIMSGHRRAEIDVEQSLLSTGILDSLSMLRLVLFIEEKFGVTVNDGEVIPENFETIGAIKALIERKLQPA